MLDAGAIFSSDRRFRYSLWRIWRKEKRPAMFLMLNPSTADETSNDPTVERCQRYALRWGFGGLIVCNIFAYRATNPVIMKAQPDPIGPENDAAILVNAGNAGVVVCAWGNHGRHLNRSADVMAMLHDQKIITWCLSRTNIGEPGHPLYLRSDAPLVEYEYRAIR